MHKSVRVILPIVPLAAILVTVAALTWILLLPVSSSTTPTNFTITKGQGSHAIGLALKSQGLIRSSTVFDAYITLHNQRGSLKAGTYALYPGMSLPQIAKALVTADVLPREKVITILEGWNTDQIGAYLEQQGLFSAADWKTAVQTDVATLLPGSSYSVLASKPASENLEGYLFPDTYRVFRDAKPADIIKVMLANTQKKISADMIAGFTNHGLSVHQAITMASIVEKEARRPADKKGVAEVFYNRMKIGMPLQSDVTVLYALHSTSTTVTNQDLQIDSPYNTYKNQGLPPGPIANPGLDALNAVANPATSDYYYFLAAPDGTVYYAKTLEEHNVLKAKYLK